MSLLSAALVTLAVAVAATMLPGGPARRPTPALGGPVVAPAAPHRAIPRMRRSARTVQPSSLAAWADDLARALRHGSSLHAALTHTMPTDPVIERHSAPLRHWLGRGATVAEACDEWSEELGAPHNPSSWRRQRGDHTELLVTMSAVLAATASLGGAAAAPLDRFAIAMRQRASDDLERTAQSAQAQLSAKVLTSVPVAVLALLLLTDGDVRAIIASARGGFVVATGLGLNALGALWMRRIVGGGDRSRAW